MKKALLIFFIVNVLAFKILNAQTDNTSLYPFISTKITAGYPHYIFANSSVSNDKNYFSEVCLTGNLKYLQLSVGYFYNTKNYRVITEHPFIKDYNYKLEYHNFFFDFASPLVPPERNKLQVFIVYGFNFNSPFNYSRIVNYRNGVSERDLIKFDHNRGGISTRIGLKF